MIVVLIQLDKKRAPELLRVDVLPKAAEDLLPSAGTRTGAKLSIGCHSAERGRYTKIPLSYYGVFGTGYYGILRDFIKVVKGLIFL